MIKYGAVKSERVIAVNERQEKILKLKKERDALVLAHYYQPLEIQDIADHVGDSFALAKLAQEARQSVVILCGVRFMAESAKILNPDKTVYLSNDAAGCPMADMATPEDVLALKERYPEAAVMCYVNSSAAVKAVSDVCCTSSSAEKLAAAIPERQIVFVPDRNLGSYIAEMLPDKELILFDGCCPIHDAIRADSAKAARERYPEGAILAHPECPAEVRAYADYVGSTAGILDYARKSEAKTLIIGTEDGICEILRREMPDREIVSLQEGFRCVDMKKTTLEDVIACLEGERKPIELPQDEMEGAARSLRRMIELG